MAAWADLDDSGDEEEEALMCLTAHTETQNEIHTCFQTEAVESEWYLDSECSRHMTGDPSKFSQLTLQNEGSVKFSDNSKGSVIGKGTIGSPDSMVIDEILLVTELKHNLLSISQLCDKGYTINFDQNKCSGIVDNEVRFIVVTCTYIAEAVLTSRANKKEQGKSRRTEQDLCIHAQIQSRGQIRRIDELRGP
ncbi:hypothetical protein MLD38_021104 [Melastoma candidum]|uniref:Uncharacterized protein n=1 Tax=Melastoma candidum TaxID=119954 RepID=A0ACB9QFB5_9MYRT|nr:hypothetical protein MLD38_021104 [Melastoma candidum]